MEHVWNVSYAVNAVCSLDNRLQACVSERRFCPAENSSNKPPLSLSLTRHATLPPTQWMMLHTCMFFSLGLCFSLTHTCRHKSHRIWQKTWFDSLLRPLAAAPTHSKSQQPKSDLLSILLCTKTHGSVLFMLASFMSFAFTASCLFLFSVAPFWSSFKHWRDANRLL